MLNVPGYGGGGRCYGFARHSLGCLPGYFDRGGQTMRRDRGRRGVMVEVKKKKKYL